MDAQMLVQLMLDQATDYALILLDADGKVVAWLMGAANTFGRDANEMRGRTLHCLFTPEDQAAGVPESELENARRTAASPTRPAPSSSRLEGSGTDGGGRTSSGSGSGCFTSIVP